MKKFLLLLALTAITFTGCFEDGLGPDEPNVIDIELSQSEFTLTGDAGEYELTVTSDYAWNASSNREWITLVNDSGKAGESSLTFKVSKNSTGSDREGLITIFCDSYNLSVDVVITQSEELPILKIAGEPIVHSAISVDVPLKTNALVSVGYKLVEKGVGTAPSSATLLFRTGKQIEGNPEVIHLTGNDGLDRGKTFVVYIAATISDAEFYNDGEILSVEFATPNTYGDEDVQVLRTHSEGADILVQIPERIKQQGRRIKWGIANLAMLEYYGQAPIPDKLHSNDAAYPASLLKNDTTLIINHHNAYRRNANGEIGYYYFPGYNPDGTPRIEECGPDDPRVATGEATPIQYYQHFQPGEPLVLMMSEVGYADCPYIDNLSGSDYKNHIANGECGHLHPTIDFGWGPGWYWYPYDYNAYAEAGYPSNIDFNQYWYDGAWYKQIEITLPGPQQFVTGSVDVNVSNLKADGGRITFTPTGDTFAYFATILPETSNMGAGYRDLLKYVNNNPSLLQWLTTSEIAPYLGILPYYESEGVIIMNLEDVLYEIEAGMTYHIIVNAVPGKMVDGDLMPDVSKQSFQHITFTLPEYTLPEPELVVTAYESYSPYKAKFNIKNANPSLPVKKVVYAANDTREFSAMFTQGYTYTDLVMMNNGLTDLSEAEVAEVNSDFGYDMEFDVRENTHFTLAVMGWNSEGRPSNPDKEGSKGVAEATTSAVPDAAPLDMEKLNALKGDWTATATIKTLDHNTGATSTSTRSWKVTIGDLKTNNTLSAADYAVFEAHGINKEAADAYLAQFNEQSAAYNASVLGQNRVLCQGWDISGTRETSTASPWDLFLMEDYNAPLVDYLFYDFGPKWFLQTDENGNIFVPVNYNRIQPLTRWYNGMDHYLCLGNYEQGYANYFDLNDPDSVQSVGIPVEISADGQTVTIKSYNYDGITLYPNVIYDNQGSLYFYNPYIVSEVVLTKGWNGGTTRTPAKASSNKIIPGKKVVNGELFKSPAKVHSRTVFAPQPKVKTTVITKKQPTREEIDNGLKQLQKRFSIGR